MAKKQRLPVGQLAPPNLSSLAELLRERGVEITPEISDERPSAAPNPAAAEGPDLSRSGSIVVRRERKGHGGKTVTVIDGLKLSTAHLEIVARQMRRSLGCGAWIDAGRVHLQGDLAPAAETWLQRHGARKVTRAN